MVRRVRLQLFCGASCGASRKIVTQLRRLGLICFFTIKASVTMCDYVTTDKPRYNPEATIMEACDCVLQRDALTADACDSGQGVTELLQCRLTLKNFAWNEHWLMFIPYGVLKEVRPRARVHTLAVCADTQSGQLRSQLYDMMVPVIFGLGLFGVKLGWSRGRKVRVRSFVLMPQHNTHHLQSADLLHGWYSPADNRIHAHLARSASRAFVRSRLHDPHVPSCRASASPDCCAALSSARRCSTPSPPPALLKSVRAKAPTNARATDTHYPKAACCAEWIPTHGSASTGMTRCSLVEHGRAAPDAPRTGCSSSLALPLSSPRLCIASSSCRFRCVARTVALLLS